MGSVWSDVETVTFLPIKQTNVRFSSVVSPLSAHGSMVPSGELASQIGGKVGVLSSTCPSNL